VADSIDAVSAITPTSLLHVCWEYLRGNAWDNLV